MIVSNTRLMLATMGILILEPLVATEQITDVTLGQSEESLVESRDPIRDVSPEFYSHRCKQERATLVKSGNEWVLKKGSWLLETGTEQERKLRAPQSKNIVENVTNSDISFRSPNQAAVFVTGRNTNARVFWCDADGKKLGDYLTTGEI